jgi:hypothetical protein
LKIEPPGFVIEESVYASPVWSAQSVEATVQ